MIFNLLTDHWIRAVTASGQPVTVSLEVVLLEGESLADIVEPPMTRLAILRLLLAMNSSQWQGGKFGLMGEDAFLQVEGLPLDSARTPENILAMQDGGGPALGPVNKAAAITEPDLARALVTAYFCDRGGLKARGPGLPISAAKPLHVGQLVAFKAANNLGEFLALNAVPASDWAPWWYRPIDYGEAFAGDLVQYLLWPWRRVRVTEQGVVIAAGTKFTGLDNDPWVIGRAALRHLNGLGKDAPEYDADVTALVLSQATPVACWRLTHSALEASEVGV